MSSQSPYANLDPAVLAQLFGLIEPVEGFGDDQLASHIDTGPKGPLYLSGGVPDIGYGMNLLDTNSLYRAWTTRIREYCRTTDNTPMM